MIELQPRDRQILNLAYEQQFVTMKQIETWVFSEQTKRRANQRILALERSGLLKSELPQVGFQSRIIRLTRSGIKVAETDRAERIPQVKRISIQTLLHDSFVTAVRLRLGELWNAVWIPERLLKAEQFAQIPDGLLVFPSGATVAIEVENTPKGPKRFREIQERWRGSSVKLCLYVATSDVMFRVVKSYLLAGPRDLPFGVVNWRDLEAGTPEVFMAAGEINIFTRREL